MGSGIASILHYLNILDIIIIIIPLLNIDRLDVLYHIAIQAELFVLFIDDSFLIYFITYLNI